MSQGMDWNEREFFTRLKRCVNMDTPSEAADAINGFSKQLQQEFESIGCIVDIHKKAGGDILECRLGSGEKQILLLGHMDTVFDLGTAAQRPYHEAENRAYGPGVLDMKSGVLMILEIMRAFAGKLPEDFSLCALLNCDEETGSEQSRDLIAYQGSRSVACLCLEPCKPGHCTVARKGIIKFRIWTNGISAHSGVNYDLGFSAIQGLCNVVTELYKLRDDERGISVNIGGISGGENKNNIVADHGQCVGEIRFYEPELIEELCKKLSRIASQTAVENVSGNVEITGIRPAMKQTEASRKLYEMARMAAQSNGLELNPKTHGGASDAAFVSALGVPVVDGMGTEGEFAHTDREYMRMDTLGRRLQTCIDLIGMLIERNGEL